MTEATGTPAPDRSPRSTAVALGLCLLACAGGLWLYVEAGDDSRAQKETALDGNDRDAIPLNARYGLVVIGRWHDVEESKQRFGKRLIEAGIPFRTIFNVGQPGGVMGGPPNLPRIFPSWPGPVPVAIGSNGSGIVAIHLLGESDRAGELLNEFVRRDDWETIKPKELLLKEGGFEGDCLGEDAKPWRYLMKQTATDGSCLIEEHGGTRALHLRRMGDAEPPASCYQELKTENCKGGAIMALRFRAWTNEEWATVRVALEHRTMEANTDIQVAAIWFRETQSRAVPFFSERRQAEHNLTHALSLDRHPKTYLILWEWPPASDKVSCALAFASRQGSVWVDDVEAFVLSDR